MKLSRLLFTALILASFTLPSSSVAFEIPSDLGRIQESTAGNNGKTINLGEKYVNVMRSK